MQKLPLSLCILMGNEGKTEQVSPELIEVRGAFCDSHLPFAPEKNIRAILHWTLCSPGPQGFQQGVPPSEMN